MTMRKRDLENVSFSDMWNPSHFVNILTAGNKNSLRKSRHFLQQLR